MRDNAKAVVREVFKQPIYSLIRREIEEEILPFCQREGIGVIVYSPMASGLLTGKMTRDRIANSRMMIGATLCQLPGTETFGAMPESLA